VDTEQIAAKRAKKTKKAGIVLTAAGKKRIIEIRVGNFTGIRRYNKNAVLPCPYCQVL
jgi:ribosomal protein L35